MPAAAVRADVGVCSLDWRKLTAAFEDEEPVRKLQVRERIYRAHLAADQHPVAGRKPLCADQAKKGMIGHERRALSKEAQDG